MEFSMHVHHGERESRGVIRITMSGTIDERAKLDSLDTAGLTKLIIDADEVKGINSVGIRQWIKWIDPIVASGVQIEFQNVRQELIFQFNLVRGFFPKGAKIRSFYIPLSCESCNTESSSYVEYAQPVDTIKLSDINKESLKKGICRKAACAMEPDYLLPQYLNFLIRAS